MSEFATADHARTNIVNAGILTAGLIIITAVSWKLNKTEPIDLHELPVGKRIARHIIYACMGGISIFLPRPYASFAYIDGSLWGGFVHRLIAGIVPSSFRWSPWSEFQMFVGNPAFYSGIIIGYLIHCSAACSLWVLFPAALGFAAILLSVILGPIPIPFGDAVQALAPTVVSLFGPHAFIGYFLGRKVWRLRRST